MTEDERRHMPGERVIEVPGPDAPMMDIWAFAITFNAPALMDSGQQRELAEATRRGYKGSGELPNDLATLRTILFRAQREDHWGGRPTSEAEIAFVRAIVARIASVSGGQVTYAHDVV